MKTKTNSISLLDELLGEITPKEQKRATDKMLLAAKIYDGMVAKGWNQKQFAKALDQNESMICRWLGGKHNFTVDTLFDIQEVLDICLINSESKSKSTHNVVHIKLEPQIRVEHKDVTFFNFGNRQAGTLNT